MATPSMQTAPRPFVVLGEVLCDLFSPRAGQALEHAAHLVPHIGGAPANVAVQAARLGAQVELISAIGTDPLGARVRGRLAAEGVGIGRVHRLAGKKTGLCLVEVDGDGERSFHPWREDSADQAMGKAHLDVRLLGRAALLHRGTVSLRSPAPRAATQAAVALVRKAGGLLSLDVNLRPRMFKSQAHLLGLARAATRSAHVVKATREEAAALFEGRSDDDLADALLHSGARLALLTFGAEGALLVTRGARARVSAPQVRCVDATGAGDAFLGALLADLVRLCAGPADLDALEPRDLKRLGARACYAGARATTRLGATTAMVRRLPAARG